MPPFEGRRVNIIQADMRLMAATPYSVTSFQLQAHILELLRLYHIYDWVSECKLWLQPCISYYNQL